MPSIPAEDRYPGAVLKIGSSGPDVRKMQVYLNAVGQHYPSIPIIAEDAKFGPATERAVIAFQRLFGLLEDGVIGPGTWNMIVSTDRNLAQAPDNPDLYPGFELKYGDRNSIVSLLQSYLDFLAGNDPALPSVRVDGRYGNSTRLAVETFQRQNRLPVTGIVDEDTWNQIIRLKDSQNTDPEQYPGRLLRFGSSGIHVVTAQRLLNRLHAADPSNPRLVVDGRFGMVMENAVEAFQKRSGLPRDGIIGPQTWNALVSAASAPAENGSDTSLDRGEPLYAGSPVSLGSRGEDVRRLQAELGRVNQRYPAVPAPEVDGRFGADTEKSVLALQQILGLRADGIVGRETWNAILQALREPNPAPSSPAPSGSYPGIPLMEGSFGDSVLSLQRHLNQIGDHYQSIPRLAEDGKFGANTRRVVILFQRIFGLIPDGTVGPKTWGKMMEVHGQVKRYPAGAR